jgi:hypothetical protein
MSLTLNDALSHYRSVSDATHRFWGYFQAVAVGASAFAWSREEPTDIQTFIFLSVAFTVFAMLNWRLVVSSQKEAVVAAQCVNNFAAVSAPPVPPELAPMLDHVRPDPACLIGFWHAGLSIATLIAIWWRYHILLCG